jgi:glycosyltransferase involved in cell wall biosynthesis
MKIGYIMQAGVPDMKTIPLSGPANHVNQIISHLLDLGHQVCLLALIGGGIWKSSTLNSFSPIQIPNPDKGLFRYFEKVIRRIQFEFRLPYASFFESIRFAHAIRQELSSYNLLYERMGWMGFGGSIASRWLGIPLILEVNGDHFSELEMLGISPRRDQAWISSTLTKQAVSQAAYVVATGEGWRRRFIERWNFPLERTDVVENGSEVVHLLEREQLQAFQSAIDLSHTTTVIYVGGFEPWHGVQLLIKAFAKSLSRGVKLCLVLMGTGSEQKLIEQLIAELGLHPYVILTGHLETKAMANYLAKSDIAISPYCGRVEYSGLKLLDYKAAGLATIASGENGQPAVIRHGQTGLIVPPCDEDALSQAIIYLVNNTELRQKIGRKARIEAERFHSWKHTTGQLEDIFHKVLVNN